MTVDELHDVLAERLDGIRTQLERQNGRVGKVEEDVTKLKIADAYWAGGVVAVVAIIKILVG